MMPVLLERMDKMDLLQNAHPIFEPSGFSSARDLRLSLVKFNNLLPLLRSSVFANLARAMAEMILLYFLLRIRASAVGTRSPKSEVIRLSLP